MSTPGVPAPSEEMLAKARAYFEAHPPVPLTVDQERTLRAVFSELSSSRGRSPGT